MRVEADWVLPISSPPIRDGAVLVEGGTILDVGPAAELRARDPGGHAEVFHGCVLLPGLVNTHTHLDYSAFRGFARPSGFGGWMLRLLLARRRLVIEDYAASALWGAHECIRCGVTSVADTSLEGWTVARAAGEAGLRARVYLELFGLDDALLPRTMQRLESGLERLRAECGAATDGSSTVRSAVASRPVAGMGLAAAGALGVGRRPIVEPGLSPHAPYTVSARLYREAARFAPPPPQPPPPRRGRGRCAPRAGLRLATHVAESQAEVDLLMRGTSVIAHAYKAARLWTGQQWSPPGLRPVPYLAGTGALGSEMLAIHAVHVDPADIATLATTGTAVAHCPRSNRRLRCGSAPVREMVAAGVAVGLGTDSLSSNDSLDMFGEMRAALEVSRERAASGAGRARGGEESSGAPGPSGDELDAATVLRMATLDGARALGWGGLVGSLEAGKRADLIAVRLPVEVTGDPTAALVATATPAEVRMTMVDGIPMCRGTAVPDQVSEGLSSVRAKLGLAGNGAD